MNKNEFEVLYYVKKYGLSPIRDIAQKLELSIGSVANAKKVLVENGYIDEQNVTVLGNKALEPYKVNNAIIMAAGLSSRFVPISLEKPKGLLEVKGEILIERQIRQLKEAGIDDITIILGYKKESFFYLENKFNVKIIINPYYNVKNNTYTLYLARNILSNTYICSSDDYFSENVFEKYVYNSYYASVHVDKKCDEWYLIKGRNNIIQKVTLKGDEGDIMLGHVYWNNDFSSAMKKFLLENEKTGEYDTALWERIFMENIKAFPPMEIKSYKKDIIFEFDSLDELRQFDKTYIKNTRSKIMQNISRVFNTDEGDIKEFKPIKKGTVRESFMFTLFDNRYVYTEDERHTHNLSHEKRALDIAKSLEVDSSYICMDENDGWKISHYLENYDCIDFENNNDKNKLIYVLRGIHKKNIKVEWEFDPFESLVEIERKLRQSTTIDMIDYDVIKDKIIKIHGNIKEDNIDKRFCNLNIKKDNVFIHDNKTILVGWENAANADPACDIASTVINAGYTYDETREFIKMYLGNDFSEKLEYHILSYVAICAFYKLTLDMYKELYGEIMGESMHTDYCIARDFSNNLIK